MIFNVIPGIKNRIYNIENKRETLLGIEVAILSDWISLGGILILTSAFSVKNVETREEREIQGTLFRCSACAFR
jgi:hypothetical protein